MKPLILIEEAELDVTEAHGWYERQREGLGDECLVELRAAIARVQAEPHGHPRVEGELRRLVVRRFPYSVVYRDEPDRIVVIAVFHAKRDPNEWRSRR